MVCNIKNKKLLINTVCLELQINQILIIYRVRSYKLKLISIKISGNRQREAIFKIK